MSSKYHDLAEVITDMRRGRFWLRIYGSNGRVIAFVFGGLLFCRNAPHVRWWNIQTGSWGSRKVVSR